MSKTQGLFIAGFLAFVIFTTTATPQDEAKAVNGLIMSVSHDDAAIGSSKAMHLIVTFRNVGTEDLNIIPGTVVSCASRVGKTSEMRLNLTDSEGQPHRHLPFLGDGPPYSAGCGGGTRFFHLLLGPGASRSFPLDLGKYFDMSASINVGGEAKFCAGTYSLQAELTGPPFESNAEQHTRNWKGTVTSNPIYIRFETDFAALLNDYPK